jgi:hypothetical protein
LQLIEGDLTMVDRRARGGRRRTVDPLWNWNGSRGLREAASRMSTLKTGSEKELPWCPRTAAASGVEERPWLARASAAGPAEERPSRPVRRRRGKRQDKERLEGRASEELRLGLPLARSG